MDYPSLIKIIVLYRNMTENAQKRLVLYRCNTKSNSRRCRFVVDPEGNPGERHDQQRGQVCVHDEQRQPLLEHD